MTGQFPRCLASLADQCGHTLLRSGLGRLLMGYLCNIAATLPPITKVMLTCFTSNEGARAFYEQMGFVTDDISPRPRVLRGGRETRAPDYVILSKVVDRLTSG